MKGPLDPDGEWVMEKAGDEAAAAAIGRVSNSGDVTYEIVNFHRWRPQRRRDS